MDRRVTKTPIREQIYNIIKKNIIELRYQPGERLSIMSISKELNVSNSPVREAISMLERDGLVETYPNAGPSVITFSNTRLGHIAEAILGMLLGSFEICQQNRQIDALIELLQRALKEQMNHRETESEPEYAKYSIAFEAAFIECCQNPYISKQYAEIEDLFYLTVLYDQWYIDTNRTKAIYEHQQILASIMNGKFETAKTLLANHYNRFKDIEDKENREG